jgi:hypothetical protein
MKMDRPIVILLGLLILLTLVPYPARAAASLRTDQWVYTIRDKQVGLVGSGLSQGQAYNVWLEGPADNRTSFTGINFNPISGGLIPPDVAIPLVANSHLGTYLVSLSTSSSVDNSIATAHFGVWGTLQPLYQRTQSVMVAGGGLFPGASVRVTIRDPAGNFVHQATVASTTGGNFNHTWRVPEDAVTDVYSIFIDGTGTYDNAQQDYVSQTKFTVTPAVLAPTITQQPKTVYQRTEKATFSFSLQYPDGSPVIKSNPTAKPVVLLQDQTTIGFASVSLSDPANGIWSAASKILMNATLSQKYRFELAATSFDDSYGNKGGPTNVYSNYFEVTNASLVIQSQVNGTQIQIPFGQVSIISKVTYPDGSELTNGTVRLVVSTGSSVAELNSVYDPRIHAWRASYSSTFSDIWSVGTWTLKISAADPLGNSGTATYHVAAQPYLFIVLLAVLVAALLFGRWTVNRYGRRLYFRARKAVQKFRPSGR